MLMDAYLYSAIDGSFGVPVSAHTAPLTPTPHPPPLATTINLHVVSPAVHISSNFRRTQRGTSGIKTITYIYTRSLRPVSLYLVEDQRFPTHRRNVYIFTSGTSGGKRRLISGCNFCLQLTKLLLITVEQEIERPTRTNDS